MQTIIIAAYHELWEHKLITSILLIMKDRSMVALCFCKGVTYVVFWEIRDICFVFVWWINSPMHQYSSSASFHVHINRAVLSASVPQEAVKTENNEHINLKVAGQDGSVVQFKIKRHTPLIKLMKAYCERQVGTAQYHWEATRTFMMIVLSQDDGLVVSCLGTTGLGFLIRVGAESYSTIWRSLNCATAVSGRI